MVIPVTYYVNVSVSLTPAGAPQAGFGSALYLNDHDSVSADVLMGPYTSPAEVLADGHASGSDIHNFAVAYAQQSPRASQFYSGLLNTGSDVSTALDAIESFDPAAFYGIAMVPRTSTEILDLADWVEARHKIAMVQSNDPSILDDGEGMSWSVLVGGTATDGTYILTFTGFGLVAPVDVTVTRAAGVPATNADIGDAFRTALTTAAGGSLSGELVTASIGGTGATVTFQTADGLIGTVTASGTAVAGAGDLTVTLVDADIASQLFVGQYTRTALWYRATDSDLLAERVLARGLGYNLDVQQGEWSWRELFGISGETLTGAQAANIREANANYFAATQMSAGSNTRPFTFPGRFPNGSSSLGRRISVTTSLDYMHARLEEALVSVLLQSSHGELFDGSGIGKFDAVTKDAFAKFVAARHLTRITIPAGEEDAGETSPFVKWPKPSEVSSAVKQSGVLTAVRAVGHIPQSIDRVVFSLEVRQ